MSLLIFSDIHLDLYRRFSTMTQNGMNSRLVNQIQVMDQVRNIASIHKPEAIVFLGDLFHGQGSNINKLLYLKGYELIDQLQQIAPVYLIVGNHDMFGGMHILSPMATMPNVIIVEKTGYFNLLGMNIAMTPWADVIPISGDILLGHLDIEGVKTGIGYELPGTIHPKEVSNFKLVISGHYHTYQKVPPNILYCGAVMPITFGDGAEDDYGCLLLNSNLGWDRIIIDSPKFLPIKINSQKEIDKFTENKQGNYYKLILTDRKITIPKFDHTVEIEWDIVEEMKSRLNYEVDTPLEDILCAYIEQANTQVDKEQAIKILKEVMKEC